MGIGTEMKNLFIILTNNNRISDIDACRVSWLRSEDYLLLSDVNIPELNSVGFDWEDGVSHKTNHKLFNLFRHKHDLILDYDWVTFLDDYCYIFNDKVKKELEIRMGSRLPRIMGNDTITKIDNFINSQAWGHVPEENLFNLRTGISINKAFAIRTIDIFKSFKKNEHVKFLNETLLDDMFFYFLTQKIDPKITQLKNRVFINACENFEEHFKEYSIIGGLNAAEKTLILEKG